MLDLIEQVAAVRGRLNAMGTEWEDVKAQVKKSYQRMEKANERAEKREKARVEGWDDDEEERPHHRQHIEPTGFERKLADFKAG